MILTVTNDINTFYYSINISKYRDNYVDFFEGINVKAYIQKTPSVVCY